MSIPAAPFNGSAADSADAPGSLLDTARQLLRGRWWFAAIAGSVLAAVGAVVGHSLVQPTYRGQAVLEFKAVDPKVLYGDDRVTPLFDTYVDTRLLQLQSESVAQAAMSSPLWIEMGEIGDISPRKFLNSIITKRGKRAQHVELMFEHEHPRVAQVGAKVAAEAFVANFQAFDRQESDKRYQQLQANQEQTRSRLQELQAREVKLSGELDATGLHRLYEARLADLNQTIRDLEVVRAMQAMRGPGGGVEPGTDLASDPGSLDAAAERMAQADETLDAYLRTRAMIDRELALLGPQIGARHTRRVQLEQQRADLDEHIASRLEALQDSVSPTVIDPGNGRTGPDVAVSAEQYEAQVTMLQERRKSLESETAGLSRRVVDLRDIQEEITFVRQNLRDFERELEKIRIESQGDSRLNVLSADNPVSTAHLGNKRKQATVLGAGGGAGVGVGLVMLLGWFDRRVRNVRDVLETMPSMPILGLLPNLDLEAVESEEGESTLNAAMTVQEIRSQLQHERGDQEDGHVVLITSAGPGAGKTSLSSALAMSFARSGMRTLLVDLDFVGRGVSRCSHLANPDAEDPGGIVEAFNGEKLSECITATGTHHLWVLPVGDASIQDVGTLNPKAVGSLLRRVRKGFDVVVIDSGPVLGSIECGYALPEADQVVLMVAKAECRDDTRAAIEKIKARSTRLVGIIYNLANQDDYKCYRSSIGSRMSQDDRGGNHFIKAAPTSPQAQAFGPLASAIFAYLPELNGRSKSSPKRKSGKEKELRLLEEVPKRSDSQDDPIDPF